MVPTFTPPSEPYSQIDRHGPRLPNRLMRYYGTLERGRNIHYLSDGSVTETDPDSRSVFWTEDAGSPYVLKTWWGGHRGEKVSAAEQSALEAAGYSVVSRHLLLNGSNGCFAWSPDSPQVRVQNNLDIRVHIALDDWTAAPSGAFTSNQVLMARRDDTRGASGAGNAFDLRVGSSLQSVPGNLLYYISPGAGLGNVGSSTSAPSVVDGAALWVRMTYTADGTVTFYTAPSAIDPPISWDQLGTTRTVSNIGNIWMTPSDLLIGARLAYPTVNDPVVPGKSYRTVDEAVGKVYRALLLEGGVVVADFDPDDAFGAGDTSWVSKTGEVWYLSGSASLV